MPSGVLVYSPFAETRDLSLAHVNSNGGRVEAKTFRDKRGVDADSISSNLNVCHLIDRRWSRCLRTCRPEGPASHGATTSPLPRSLVTHGERTSPSVTIASIGMSWGWG